MFLNMLVGKSRARVGGIPGITRDVNWYKGGGFLVVAGFLLSPLSWWNDLVINIPLALGFAWAVSYFWHGAFEAFWNPQDPSNSPRASLAATVTP